MTYNLLGQHHIWNDMYPYCSPGVLKQAYRRQRLLAEFDAYGPWDVAAFQEVAPVPESGAASSAFWKESWEAKGYECLFATKADHRDALVTVFNASRFTCLFSQTLSFAPLMMQLEATANVAQVSLLASIQHPSLQIIFTNTHLFWRPEFDCLRVLQAHRLRRTVEELESQQNYSETQQSVIIMCGDWNSDPNGIVYQLMTGRPVDPQAWDALVAAHAQLLPFADESSSKDHSEALFAAVMADFRSWPPMMSAYSQYRAPADPGQVGEPPHTSVNAYVDTLDYIFFRSNCDTQVGELLSLPPDEIVFAHTALPNEIYASDHLALVAKLDVLHQ